MYLHIIIVLFFSVHIQAEQCTTPNNERGDCIPLHSCSILYTALQTGYNAEVERFINRSICGNTPFITMVCCGTSSNFSVSGKKIATPEEDRNNTKKSLLASKRFCGFQHSDDYFRTVNHTSVRINEFPWVAQLLRYLKMIISEDPVVTKRVLYSFCTGSLINTRYVLTSGECVIESVLVRLGEYHIYNATDCILEPPFEEECSGGIEDFGIEGRIRHPSYNDTAFSTIGLLRLNKSVIYSDYIRPICLPSHEMNVAKVGDELIASGWGYSVDDGELPLKKKIFHSIISNEECSNTYSPLNENFMCTVLLNNNTDSTCYGDYGGPVMFPHGRNMQWYQIGITYYQSVCEQQKPRRHTKVENYIDWIEANMEP